VIKQQEQKIAKQLAALEARQKETAQQLSRMQQQQHSLKKLLQIKASITQALQEVMKGDPYYDAKHLSLNFATLHLFEEGALEPLASKRKTMEASVQKYLGVLSRYRPYLQKIVIHSYSDSKGNAQSNLTLTRQRAEKIKALLLQSPALKQYGMDDLFAAKGEGETNLVLIDGEEDHEASRRIVIDFTLDKKKIDKAIEMLLK
jgi:chemotaxis protein MotB